MASKTSPLRVSFNFYLKFTNFLISLNRVTPVKNTTMEAVKTIGKLKFTSKMLTKKTLALMNPEDRIRNHHTPVNRLDNSNIKVDSEFQDVQPMLEPPVNLHNKEIQ